MLSVLNVPTPSYYALQQCVIYSPPLQAMGATELTLEGVSGVGSELERIHIAEKNKAMAAKLKVKHTICTLCPLALAGVFVIAYIWYIMVCTHFRKSYIINPRRACAARVTVVVVCVCLSVRPRAISLHEPSIAPQTIPRIQCRIKVEKYVGFSLKLLRSGITA